MQLLLDQLYVYQWYNPPTASDPFKPPQLMPPFVTIQCRIPVAFHAPRAARESAGSARLRACVPTVRHVSRLAVLLDEC